MGPLGRTGAALTGVAGALLSPGLLAAAGHFGAGQSALGALTAVCQVIHHDGMDGGLVGFYAENALGEFHLADLLASHIIDVCFRHFSNSPFLTGFWQMPSGGWHVRKPSAG